MKKLLFILALTSFAFVAKSQDTVYRKFKIDLGVGFGTPTADNTIKSGIALTLEPHYHLHDNLTVGLRVEYAALLYKGNTTELGGKMGLVGSYCFTGEQYFLTSPNFRPFIGVGAGFFTRILIYQYNIDYNPYTPALNSLGGFPVLGFEAGHMRVSASYNIAGNNSSYFSFKLGFFLGGGDKTADPEIMYYKGNR